MCIMVFLLCYNCAVCFDYASAYGHHTSASFILNIFMMIITERVRMSQFLTNDEKLSLV